MGRLSKEIKYKKIRKIWYFNVKDTGFKSSGTETKAECIRIAKKKLKELEEENNSLNGEKISFFDYANKFFISTTCPRAIRKADEGHTLSNRYLEVQRINLETHILPSRLKLQES